MTLYLWYKHYDKCQSCAEHCDDGGKHEQSWRIIFNNDADSGSNCAQNNHVVNAYSNQLAIIQGTDSNLESDKNKYTFLWHTGSP